MQRTRKLLLGPFDFLGSALASIPPILWMLLYVGLIFLFAAVYTTQPEDFYHSTIQYEPAITNDGVRLQNELAAAIVARISQLYGGPMASVQDWEFDTTTIEVRDIAFQENSVTFLFSGFLRPANPATPEPSGSGVQVFQIGVHTAIPVTTQLSGLTHDSDNPNPTYTHVLSFEAEDNVVDYSGDFMDPAVLFAKQGEPVEYAPEIFLGAEVEQHLTDYWSAFTRGRPLQSSGHYQRMLYFSAVTITTVGFGDITPITPWARKWTAIEAVSGIVVIGLFLNSLFQRRDEPQSRLARKR